MPPTRMPFMIFIFTAGCQPSKTSAMTKYSLRSKKEQWSVKTKTLLKMPCLHTKTKNDTLVSCLQTKERRGGKNKGTFFFF